MMRRREFLATLLPTLAVPHLARSKSLTPVGPNRLWIAREGEPELNHRFLYDGGIYRSAWISFTWHWRDIKDRSEAVWVDPHLLIILARMQDEISRDRDEPTLITLLSGYRTPARNATIEGAAPDSMHLYGKASDIAVSGMPPDEVAQYAERAGASGIGVYQRRGFTHIDTGPPGRRWSK